MPTPVTLSRMVSMGIEASVSRGINMSNFLKESGLETAPPVFQPLRGWRNARLLDLSESVHVAIVGIAPTLFKPDSSIPVTKGNCVDDRRGSRVAHAFPDSDARHGGVTPWKRSEERR